MALDLSTVSETQLEDGDQSNSSNCVLLYSEAITIPGTNDILFEVSASGQLILANFSIERRNGSHFLRKHVSDTPTFCLSPEHPTNLSVEKNTGALLPVHNNESSYLSSRPIACEAEPLPATAVEFVDSVPQNLSTLAHSTWNALHATDMEHAQVEDLSVAEKPVDATVPRAQTAVTQDPMPAEGAAVYVDDDDRSIMSQLVKTILKENASDSDTVVSGNNLSELQRFVERLKAYRQSVGMSQYQLSRELARHYGQQTIFSQSLLSRFELLSVTVRAAFRFLPYLKNWLDHAEQAQSDSATTTTTTMTFRSDSSSIPVRALGKSRLAALVRLGYPPGYGNGTRNKARCCADEDISLSTNGSDRVRSASHITDQDALPESPAAKSCSSDSMNCTPQSAECRLTDPDTRLSRRERTHFTLATRAILAAAYEKNPRPKGQELTRLATETGHNRESIRIWFCNRRQLTNQTKSRKNNPE